MARRSWNNGVASSTGWQVVRHEQSQTVMLMQGIRAPWGYVQLAWTAGNRQDGRNLLAEMTAKDKEATA